jgi:hypothetical protein
MMIPHSRHISLGTLSTRDRSGLDVSPYRFQACDVMLDILRSRPISPMELGGRTVGQFSTSRSGEGKINPRLHTQTHTLATGREIFSNHPSCHSPTRTYLPSYCKKHKSVCLTSGLSGWLHRKRLFLHSTSSPGIFVFYAPHHGHAGIVPSILT